MAQDHANDKADMTSNEGGLEYLCRERGACSDGGSMARSMVGLLAAAALLVLTACSSSASSSSSFYTPALGFTDADQATCNVFTNGDSPVEVADWSQGTGYGDDDGPAASRLQILANKWANDSTYGASNTTVDNDAHAIASWCNAHGFAAAVPSGY